MSEMINLSIDQLKFITFMKENASGRQELIDRIEACIDKLTVADDRSQNELRHSPRKMVEFLSLFSRDDYFKWFTHKWDQEELTLENMIEEQPRKKSELSNRLYKSNEPINDKTYNQVWNFINFKPNPDTKYYWTDNKGERATIGWHSIIDLHKDNPDVPIENLKLPDGSLFKDIIRTFKSSIEFRTDLQLDDRFNKVVRNTLKKVINGAVKIDYSSQFKKTGPYINIYCDVPSFESGLNTIADWIVKHKAIGEYVSIDLKSAPGFYELIIFHHDSSFDNEKKLINASGDFAKLRNCLFSVCDLTLEGDLRKDGEKAGSIVVHALDANTVKKEKQLQDCNVEYSDNSVGGVKYILKLYKS